MEHYAADYYDKPKTKIDGSDSGNWIGLAIIFALSGSIIGFLIGYNLHTFLGWL